MFLQVYIDDGGRDDVELAVGLVAHGEAWDALNREWIVELARDPAIPYWHGRERHGMSAAQRDARALRLSEIINRHVELAILTGASRSQIKGQLAGKMSVTLHDAKMHMLFMQMILACNINLLSARPRDIAFIFDRVNDRAHQEIESFWANMRLTKVPGYWHLIPPPPAARSAKDCQPLQAADLYIWSQLRSLVDTSSDGLGNKLREVLRVSTSFHPMTTSMIAALRAYPGPYEDKKGRAIRLASPDSYRDPLSLQLVLEQAQRMGLIARDWAEQNTEEDASESQSSEK